MDVQDIQIPSEEPMVAAMRRTSGVNDGAEHNTPDTEERLQKLRSDLPWYFAEKFHWHASESGFIRLRPNAPFLAAVEADAPEFERYGYKLNHPEDGAVTTEAGLVQELSTELGNVLESLEAIDEREVNAFKRWVTDRCTNNCVYAAINQFEIDNWVARNAKSETPKDLSNESNFGEKCSRRDSFASAGALWGEVARKLFNDANLADTTFQKAARSTIYTQADMRGRELLNPAEETRQETAAVAGAVAASRPF